MYKIRIVHSVQTETDILNRSYGHIFQTESAADCTEVDCPSSADQKNFQRNNDLHYLILSLYISRLGGSTVQSYEV